jgi:hypothetical protein
MYGEKEGVISYNGGPNPKVFFDIKVCIYTLLKPKFSDNAASSHTLPVHYKASVRYVMIPRQSSELLQCATHAEYPYNCLIVVLHCFQLLCTSCYFDVTHVQAHFVLFCCLYTHNTHYNIRWAMRV